MATKIAANFLMSSIEIPLDKRLPLEPSNDPELVEKARPRSTPGITTESVGQDDRSDNKFKETVVGDSNSSSSSDGSSSIVVVIVTYTCYGSSSSSYYEVHGGCLKSARLLLNPFLIICFQSLKRLAGIFLEYDVFPIMFGIFIGAVAHILTPRWTAHLVVFPLLVFNCFWNELSSVRLSRVVAGKASTQLYAVLKSFQHYRYGRLLRSVMKSLISSACDLAISKDCDAENGFVAITLENAVHNYMLEKTIARVVRLWASKLGSTVKSTSVFVVLKIEEEEEEEGLVSYLVR
uniref:Uncharacterized protein n=1 Tax=Glossina pallidipes TaxID=7398 RepID=A0A1A9Z6Z6_GLOPL